MHKTLSIYLTRLRRLPVWCVWLAGLIPLALLVWDALNGGLGADPVRMIEHRLGRTALYFLIASLAVTPLRRLGLNLIRYRRALGLLSFTYAALHVVVWVILDMGLRWGQMAGDILKRPYLGFGMAGFVILVILAATSSAFVRRGLGRHWNHLHRLVYVGVILGVVHWVWSLKVYEIRVLVVGFVVVILLLVRLIPRSRVSGVKKQT